MNNPIRSAAFEQRVTHLMQQVQLPGISICTLRDGLIDSRVACGVTDARTREPLTTATVFEAASLGKPVFAYWVLQLCEQGILCLDQPLYSYLSNNCKQSLEVVAGIANERMMQRITARHILSHSSGLPNWPTPGELLTCEFEPGERFNYSSAGFNYLQYVVEQLTGKACDEQMKCDVFEPLGMDSTSYTNRLLIHQGGDVLIAQGHDAQGHVVPRQAWQTMIASSSLLSTPSDYALFLMHMVKQQKLKTKIVQEMLNPQLKIDGTPVAAWGIGWGLQTTPAQPLYWHWGDNQIFTSMTLVEQDSGNGIVIMANGARGFEVFRAVIADSLNTKAVDYPVISGLEAIYELHTIGL